MQKQRRSKDNSKRNEQTEEKRRGSIYGLRYSHTQNTNVFKRRNPGCVPIKQRVKYITNGYLTDSDDFNPVLLYYLQQTTWCLNRLSPLHNIDYREVALKKYAARITQALAKNIKDVENNLSITTKIIEINTKESEENDNNNYKTLQIEIKQKKGDNKEVTRFKGLILNWSKYSGNNGKNLPLLLCNGTVMVKRIVHNTLQEIFNIVISPFQISGDDIYWLCVLAGFSTKVKEKYFQLYYQLPGSKDTLKLVLLVKLANELWNSIHKEDSDEITFEEVKKFKDKLNEEFYEGYNIRTNKLCLHKVALPVLTLQTEGKVKFNDADHIEKIIYFFQDMADILTPLNFSES